MLCEVTDDELVGLSGITESHIPPRYNGIRMRGDMISGFSKRAARESRMTLPDSIHVPVSDNRVAGKIISVQSI